MSTRRVVMISTIAALYFVFTVAIAPISYGPIQFRVSEVLKVLVLFNPVYALGIGLGTFFANMISPFAGPWDLIWMPLTDMAGGVLAWLVYRAIGRRWAIIPMAMYALTTGAAVGLMLSVLLNLPYWAAALPVAGSELIILMAGVPLIFGIKKLLDSRGFEL
jgi:uncharacterized membrane protein